MTARLGAGGIVALTLLGAHLLLGVGRVPGKVYGDRFDEIERYRDNGAATFLMTGAVPNGPAEIDWLREHTPERCVLLWRWPADGALEFAAALLGPRLVVDERVVPAGATTFLDLPIATGELPSGERGQLVLQGTDDGGLRLTVRPE